MPRELFVVHSYEVTASVIGDATRPFTLNCFSDTIKKRGTSFRYRVRIAPDISDQGRITWQDIGGAFDREIQILLLTSVDQIDRIYTMLRTESPIRLRIEHDGGDLLADGSRQTNFVTDAKFFSGLEPVGEGEGRTVEFPE